MCTVSFIPAKDKVFITSNRDEKGWRKPAAQPAFYTASKCDMLFPRDGSKGGSWISLCSNGNAGVLLNGAFEKHEPMPPYAKSRGLVFLDTMDAANPLKKFLKQSLAGIEPFTLILWQQNNLYECRWDAFEKKHCQPLKSYRPYIWSSATLYNQETRKKREYWFAKWLSKNNQPTQQGILDFHHFAGDGDITNDLFMNRDGKVFTVSITSIRIEEEKGTLTYLDTVSNQSSIHQLGFNENIFLEVA
jgi:hypothetical protein